MAKDKIFNEVAVVRAFEDAGQEYGYRKVIVDFIPDKDLKVKWTRSADWIQLSVCDYLAEADPAVAYDIANVIFSKTRGDNADYSEMTVSWLTSAEFVNANQNTHIRRTKGMVDDDGSLMDSYGRLVKKGLIKDDPKLRMYYNSNLGKNMSEGSALMHVSKVNSQLKDVDDDEARDFALYKSVATSQIGYRASSNKENIVDFIDKYPDSDKIRRKVFDKYGLFNKKSGVSLKSKLLKKVKA